MVHLNKVMLIGRLGESPSNKTTENDISVTNFSIATNETWVDKHTGKKQEKTQWHRIVAFNKLAEICAQYLKKGRLVYLEGKLQTRSYEKDGHTHYITEIMASDIKMLEPKEKFDKIRNRKS